MPFFRQECFRVTAAVVAVSGTPQFFSHPLIVAGGSYRFETYRQARSVGAAAANVDPIILDAIGVSTAFARLVDVSGTTLSILDNSLGENRLCPAVLNPVAPPPAGEGTGGFFVDIRPDADGDTFIVDVWVTRLG